VRPDGVLIEAARAEVEEPRHGDGHEERDGQRDDEPALDAAHLQLVAGGVK
jgi:hypothetical protein